VLKLISSMPRPLRRVARRVVKKASWPFTVRWLSKLSQHPDPAAAKLAAAIRAAITQGFDGESEHWIEQIEAQRRDLAACVEPLISEELGEPGPFDDGVSVALACSHSAVIQIALVLHALVREFRPETALELGTNIGLSAAYEAAAMAVNRHGRLVTLEVSPHRTARAKVLHKALQLADRVTYVNGYFQDTLENTLESLPPIDFAFITDTIRSSRR